MVVHGRKRSVHYSSKNRREREEMKCGVKTNQSSKSLG